MGEDRQTLERKARAALELKRRKITASFFEFVKEFWSVIIPEEPVYNWHIPYLCEELEKVGHAAKDRRVKDYDLVINVPPGTSKSTICTIMFPVWLWTIDPTLVTLSGSYDLDLSTEHAVKSRDIIRCRMFRLLFPNILLKGDKDNKRNYQNTLGGERMVTSPTAGSTGRHAHILIVDDPLNPHQAASDTYRNRANNWIGQTLSSRKKDKKNTPMVVVMQRLHEEDPADKVLKKDKVRHICLPGEIDDNVSPVELRDRYVDGLLDPSRLDREVLNEMKTDLGSYGYAGQVLQKPAPDEGGLLKKAWFEIISWEEFIRRTSNNVTWNFTLDPAYTKNTANDPSAIMSGCNHRDITYIRAVKSVWMESPELVKFIPEFAKDNGYTQRSMVRIEPKASGLSILQTIQRSTSLNVSQYKFPKTVKTSISDDKITRVNAIAPMCESGRVVLIEGKWTDSFLSQLASFPNAAHDDEVDCLVMQVMDSFRVQNYSPMKRV